MVIKSYMMEMGVQIDFEVTTIYPWAKVGKGKNAKIVEQTHLKPLSKTTTFSIKDRGETHHFKTNKEVIAFLPKCEVYQARSAYELMHG